MLLKATDMGGIYVNTQGKRIVNESDVYTKFRDAILAQPDKMSYLVMDERTWKSFYDLSCYTTLLKRNQTILCQ